MNLAYTLITYFVSIFIHELGHIFYYWYLKKDFAKVEVNGLNVKIIPEKKLNKEQKIMFLGLGIIFGLVPYTLWVMINPFSGFISLIAYLVACLGDIYNLIVIQVKE